MNTKSEAHADYADLADARGLRKLQFIDPTFPEAAFLDSNFQSRNFQYNFFLCSSLLLAIRFNPLHPRRAREMFGSVPKW